METKAVFARQPGPLRMDELSPYEGYQRPADGRALVVGGGGLDRAAPELAPDDRGTLEHGPLVPGQPVETACDQHSERRRDRSDRVLGTERNQLLEEQRVALGRADRRSDYGWLEGG